MRYASAMFDACNTEEGICTAGFAGELQAVLARYSMKASGCGDACQRFGDFLVEVGVNAGMMAAARLSATAGRSGLKGTAGDISFFDQLACRHSFRADTLVLMADGTIKPISKVRLGDKVKATDPRSGKTVTRTVTALTVRDARRFTGRADMYDLTVDQVHTYYVEAGGTPVLVHNCGAVTSAIGSDRFLTRAAEQAGRNQRIQQEMDSLFSQLSQGNMNPGIGTKSLPGTDVFYARGSNGARLFFRNVGDNMIQIVGKADKGNKSTVINRLVEIYGR